MAGEADITLLGLEALGTQSGKALTYGQSGRSNVLPLLTASGQVYGHATAALTVPMQVLAFTMSVGPTSQAALTVPMQTLVAHGGANASLTIPMQVISAAGTVPGFATAALTVPLQIVYGTGTSGVVGGTAETGLIVPLQTALGYGGGNAALVVPMQELAASGIASIHGTFAGFVPLQQGTGTISVFSMPGYGALVVPMIVAGPYGSAALVVPMQRIAGAFAIPAGFEAWVMNLRNKGVTRWTNFPFVQFARVGTSTYAVGSDGNLYLLGGDTDNEEPIQWSFESGLDDLGRPGQKHLPYLYMDGIIDGVIEIAVIDDRNRVYAYEYDTKQRGAVHLTHRRKLGNGIRTNNVAFRFSSTSGAYIEMDWFAPEATVTQRNI